jgi:hypothetical protein
MSPRGEAPDSLVAEWVCLLLLGGDYCVKPCLYAAGSRMGSLVVGCMREG